MYDMKRVNFRDDVGVSHDSHRAIDVRLGLQHALCLREVRGYGQYFLLVVVLQLLHLMFVIVIIRVDVGLDQGSTSELCNFIHQRTVDIFCIFTS